MRLAALPDRDLDQRELTSLAGQIAGQPGLWSHQVAFPEEGRHYVSLYRDEHVDVWLLCWTSGSDTGWHDHDGSAGAVRVVSGAVTESTPRIGGEPAAVTRPGGTSFTYDPDHIHRLTGAAGQSVSIHVYSPPLVRMGQYSIDDQGVIRRLPLGFAEELRPLTTGPMSLAS